MLKANIRNALLVALTQAAERHDQSMFNRSTPDLEAEELDRQGIYWSSSATRSTRTRRAS